MINLSYAAAYKNKQALKIWLIMKLTVFFILVACLQLSAKAKAQNITFSGKNLSLAEVFQIVKEQTGYRFFYKDELLRNAAKIKRVDVRNVSLRSFLDMCFKEQPLTYNIVEKTITLKSLLNASFVPNDIKGRIVDSSGRPLAGVAITLKGSSKNVVSNEDGQFTIDANQGDVLVVRLVGYETREVTVGSDANISVVLVQVDSRMEEVVVIGYGTAKRKDFTGAVASVKVENSPIALSPNSSPLELLKGNVSGLNIGVSNSAGSQPSILIRGQNSISGNTEPLIVLDGVIYLGSLNDINPNDIATVDVLKDAVSASVYGSRSANGVIAITTKRGKKGKPSINLSASSGVQQWQRRPVMMTGEQWIKSVNDRNGYTPGSTNWLKPGELENYNNGKETNWLDVITRTGTFANYQGSVSGASDNVNYYLSASYNNNKGIIKDDKFNRISVLSKVNAKVTKWLELGLDGAYNVLDYSGFTANIYQAEQMSPYGVMYRDDKGNLEKYPYTQSATNPLWGIGDGTTDNLDKRQNFRLNTYAVVSAPWIKGLSYRLNYSANLDKNKSGNFYYEDYFVAEGAGLDRYGASVVSGFLTNANGSLQQVTNLNYVIDNILNYKKSFGQHNLDLTAVATRDFTRNETTTISGSDFAANGNTILGIWGLSKATVQKNTLDVVQRTNIGYLARLNYEYANKYMLNASVRRDGASVFGANKKWGNFAAVGIAWRISGEEFMKNATLINDLKLKLSRGQNGNQGIAPYGTLATVVNASSGGYRYEFSNTGSTIKYGLAQSALGNSNLGWEKTAAWNFGIEGSILKRRILVDLNMYTSKTTDQLFVQEIPVMTGFKNIKSSMGQVNNKGLELSITSINIQKQDFNWTSTFNYWINRNKLARLYGTDSDGDGKEDDDLANSLFIGKSLGAIYGYEQIGIVQSNDNDYIDLNAAKPGDPKYRDIDGVPGISVNDRKILGYDKENFRMSLSNTVSYKSFELYALISGIFGGNGYYLRKNTPAYMTRSDGFNHNSIYIPYWTTDNPTNVYPSATYTADARFLGLQSRSFVRVQDVTLSYTFRQPWVQRLSLSNLRLFFSGKNLLTLTGWEGGDPELGNTAKDTPVPVPTTYTFGISARF